MRFYLVNRWAYVDGPSAMEWALGVRSTDHVKILERAWRSFSIGDRAGAIAWMEARTYSPELEPAYALYLQDHVARQDYKSALVLAEQIQDPARKMHVFQAIGRSWIVDDPEGAEAWMELIDASPDFREKVRAVRRPPEARGRIPTKG